MSAITPFYRSIKDLLQSQSFSIDDYQREYKWEKENIEELVSDLRDKFLSCYNYGHEIKKISNYEEYFLGSIIVSIRDGKKYLIDGQQRVTSLTLIIIYLYRAANEQKLDVTKTLAPLIYSDNLGTPSFNLNIAERLPVIEALFNGQEFTAANQDESVENIYARYQDIKESDLVDELGEGLPHFIYWLMTRVGLIEIVATKDSYAYSIFETMNDRGKPLSPVDMLKAYLLAPVDDMEQRRLANQIWRQQVFELNSISKDQKAEQDSTCIKAWFRGQYAETIRDRKAGASDKDWELIGSEFHRWARDHEARLKLGTATQSLSLIRNDLPFFAGAFRMVVKASSAYTPGLESIYYNAHNDFTWQPTVLMASLISSDGIETITRKLSVTATFLDIWIMRRAVNYIRVAYSSASYAMYNLCKDIRRASVDDLVEILTQKLASDDVTFAGAKSKERDGIDGLRLNQFSRKYIFHLLARLTSFVEANSGGADRFSELVNRDRKNSYDIEHIWADKRSQYADMFKDDQEFRTARDNVAGLLLLPADVNRSFQDKTFEEKAPHYAKQNRFAASLTEATYVHQPQFEAFCSRFDLPFKPYEHFGVEEQKQRAELIRKLVELVWSPERLKAVTK